MNDENVEMVEVTRLNEETVRRLNAQLGPDEHHSECPVSHEASVDCVWPLAVCVPAGDPTQYTRVCEECGEGGPWTLTADETVVFELSDFNSSGYAREELRADVIDSYAVGYNCECGAFYDVEAFDKLEVTELDEESR